MFLTYNYYILSILFIYFIVSIFIFNIIDKSSHLVIDEIFHIPQGQLYCNGNFSTWDSKITTLPGLYLISAIFLGPFGLCSKYYLRSINLLASGINLYLLILLAHKINHEPYDYKRISRRTIMTAVNIAILPPLYFFSHLYYTDTLSVTFVLMMFICKLYNNHFMASIAGAFAILIRQTNIVWVGLCFGQLCLETLHNELDKIYKKRRSTPPAPVKSYKIEEIALFKNLLHIIKSGKFKDLLMVLVPQIFSTAFLPYLLLIIAFAIFIIWNGSIVVGDKSAHQAKLHIPQIFYFSLFYGIFSITHVLYNFIDTLRSLIKNFVATILILTVFIIIIYSNTIVHPYLLADNRHYTFYFWNRLLSKDLIRYFFALIYLFALKSVLDNLKNSKLCFNLIFFVTTFAALSFQMMIEVRYFFIPFIILKLKLQNIEKLLYVEFLLYVVINAVTINVFMTKDIYWRDFNYVQRLIW